jgi:hypothetical protein
MTETITVGSFEDGVAEDGSPTRVPVETKYEGLPGRVRYGTLSASSASTGSSDIAQPVVLQTPYLSVPHGSPRFYEGDEVRVDASASDDLLAGRSYEIAGNAIVGQVTAHRYPLNELS